MKTLANPLAILAALLSLLLTTAPGPAWGGVLYLTVDKTAAGEAETDAGARGSFVLLTVNAVRQEMSDPGEMDFVPWARGLSMMSRNVPTAIFPIFRTAERKNRYQWGGPLARIKWGLYQLANATNKLHSLSEAQEKGAVIGAFRQDPRSTFFRELGLAVEEANSVELNIDKLIHGRVDLIIFSDAAMGMLEQNPRFSEQKLRPVVEFEPEDLYIAFSAATDPDYVREWNAVHKRLLENGTIRRLWDTSTQKGIIPPFK